MNTATATPTVLARRRTWRIGEAHQLAVSKDLKTVYVADSINARVLKIERD